MSEIIKQSASNRRLLNDLETPRTLFENAIKTHSQELGNFFLARLIGFQVSYIDDSCLVDFKAHEFLYNPSGTLQGGVLAMGLDIAMGHLIQRLGGRAATVALDVRYHRPVTSGNVRIKSQVLHRGGRIWTLEAKAWVEQTLAASATGTFSLLGEKPNMRVRS